MAESAQRRNVDPAAEKVVGNQLVISLSPELRKQIEDFRFVHRYNSISAAVRHLIEAGFEVEEAKVTPIRKP